jgi:putative ABC transport system ATP-binding protein
MVVAAFGPGVARAPDSRWPARYHSPMLRVHAVSKSYDGPRQRVVLQDVDLSLDAGEYVAIMGESGVGKSTLLNLIAGLERPDGGEVEVDGINLVGLPDKVLTRVRREKMGFVFQAYHVLPYLSVIQNVALPLQLIGTREREIEACAQAMLDAVELRGRARAMPSELSGGELQRVAIARALVHRPRLVLADEPTGNLDPDTADQVLALLRNQVKESGAAGILVTHSRHAAQTADRVLMLTETGLRAVASASAEAGVSSGRKERL